VDGRKLPSEAHQKYVEKELHKINFEILDKMPSTPRVAFFQALRRRNGDQSTKGNNNVSHTRAVHLMNARGADKRLSQPAHLFSRHRLRLLQGEPKRRMPS
jgi:hypothetical protein